jgi:hypothetical protein
MKENSCGTYYPAFVPSFVVRARRSIRKSVSGSEVSGQHIGVFGYGKRFRERIYVVLAIDS